MKRFLLIFLALMMFFTAGGAFAKGGSGEPSKTRQIVQDGLLTIGRAVVSEGGKRLAGKRQKPEAEQGEDAPENRKRTWGDRGSDMLEALLDNGDLGITGALKASLDVLLDEYREQFKKEGRKYARELGDALAERVVANKKISRTLTSVQVLCWGVVVYLTLVTIYLVFTVYRLRRENRRLMETVDAQIKRLGRQVENAK